MSEIRTTTKNKKTNVTHANQIKLFKKARDKTVDRKSQSLVYAAATHILVRI